jgi:hypothetical protein
MSGIHPGTAGSAGRAAGRGLRLLAACLVGLAACGARADAALIISAAPSISGAANTTGVFEVTVQNTGPDVMLFEAFSLAVSVADTAGLQFTSASTNTTTQPYVFEDISFVELGLGSFTLGVLPPDARSFVASDLVFVPPLYREVLPGQVFGLARIAYTIGAGAVSAVPVSLTFTPVATAVAIPEPASLVQAALGAALAGAGLRRAARRRRAA